MENLYAGGPRKQSSGRALSPSSKAMVKKPSLNSLPQAKSSTAAFALTIAVLVRAADILTDCLLVVRWFRDDYPKFWIQAGIMAFTAILGGAVSFWRQKSFERAHEPILSALLGGSQLQLFVELRDSIMQGRKTGALKMLLNYGALTESIPSMFFQSYICFTYNLFDTLLSLSIAASVLNLVFTHVSMEKESYFVRGLGKLPIFSPFSMVLFGYRCLELPARVLSLCLFAAQFSYYVLIVVGVDIVFLRMIRHSTFKRIEVKKARSKAALARALQSLDKDIAEVQSLDELLNEDITGVDDMEPAVLTVHHLFWVLVFTEGVDPVPYIGLRAVEDAFMVAIFLIVARSDLSTYQLAPLIITLAFMCLHLACAVAWVYWRSHSDFLHPIKDREQMKRMLLDQLEAAARYGRKQPAAKEEAQPVIIAPPPQVVERPPSPVVEVVVPVAPRPQNVPSMEADVIIREVPYVVHVPQAEKKTQAVQVDWNEEEFVPDEKPDVYHAPREQCTSTNGEEGCVTM